MLLFAVGFRNLDCSSLREDQKTVSLVLSSPGLQRWAPAVEEEDGEGEESREARGSKESGKARRKTTKSQPLLPCVFAHLRIAGLYYTGAECIDLAGVHPAAVAVLL